MISAMPATGGRTDHGRSFDRCRGCDGPRDGRYTSDRLGCDASCRRSRAVHIHFDIAAEEGRQFQVVLEEALGEWVERKRGERPRQEVMAHLAGSAAAHRELYHRLAQ